MAHAGGRPPKYTQPIRRKLLREFEQYVTETPMPIIAEFAFQRGIPKQTFYDWPEFSNLLKVAVEKKEAYLERGMVHKQLDTSASIFSLKQIGWRDKHEIESTSTERVIYTTEKADKPADAGMG
jgi:hypothetical protein